MRIIAACAVLAIAIVALGIWGRSGGGPFAFLAPAAPTAVEEPEAQGPAGKLAGSAESTDENGIVHGTTPDGINYLVFGRDEKAYHGDRVTLAAVGDVVASEYTFPIADNYAGDMDDGEYSYLPYYREAGPGAREYDLRFITQETVCASTGEGGWGIAGYPSFNSPDETIDAWVQEGFNIVNFNTNHTWDLGDWAIERTHELFARNPEIMVVGSYKSYDDRETVRLVERNGITFAFLSFCYGDNGYGWDPAGLPNEYYACHLDDDAMAADIERARAVADAVIVYMHWGTEYDPEPNETQEHYAVWLADQGVDMVIGSHAHTVQPMRYVTGESGRTIPVVFGLGDFLCGWSVAKTLMSFMFTCDFVKTDDGISIENLVMHPLIEWATDPDGYDSTVRYLTDMTDEEINANARIEDVDGSIADYLREYIADLDMECHVAWDLTSKSTANSASAARA